MARKVVPVHPGEILAEGLADLGVSATWLARQIKVPPNRLTQIIQGKRAVGADTALRLGHWFDQNPQFWLNLQARYDLDVATQKIGAKIAKLPTNATTDRRAA